jgi:cytochrome c6
MQKNRFLIFFISLQFFYLFPCFINVKAISLQNGKEHFNQNCNVCHLGGNNIIIPEKSLKKDALEENGMNTISAISYQILNGKNGMPAFEGRLQEIEIETIANYVLEESNHNFISERFLE